MDRKRRGIVTSVQAVDLIGFPIWIGLDWIYFNLMQRVAATFVQYKDACAAEKCEVGLMCRQRSQKIVGGDRVVQSVMLMINFRSQY